MVPLSRPGNAARWVLWLALVAVLCAVAVVPFVHREMPCSNDGALHFFRVAAMRRSVEHGTLFSRWLPDVAFGYGVPFFNYRGPLSYYAVLAGHLVGLPLPMAQNLVYALTFLVGAAGMYLLGRDLLGGRAALLAAVAYAYAPYRFVDAIVLGIQPEAFGLALLPFVLWAFRRLALYGGRVRFLVAVGSLIALYLSHNISSLLFTPLLVAYLVALGWVYRGRGNWLQTGTAFLFAVAITAYFWLPALVEKEYVQLYLSHATRHTDFHHNFLTVKEILIGPRPVDTSLLNPPVEVTLGTTQSILAALGLLLGLAQTDWSERDERQITLIFFGLAAIGYLLLSTRASVWLWENVPLLRFVQFPWRLVGRASLPVALLVGATLLPFRACEDGTESETATWAATARLVVPSVLIGVTIVGSLPSTYPPRGYCSRAGYPDGEDIHRYERRTGLVGVDPEGSYLPVWVEERPKESSLEVQYSSRGPIERFDDASLPDGARVVESDYGPTRARLVVESPETFEARYLAFYFPGWQVRVDGARVPVAPSDPHGLITFEVPAGRRTIDVRFGETPLRRVADVASLLALAGLVVWAIVAPRSSEPLAPAGPRLRAREWVGPVLTVLLLLGLKFGVVDRIETPLRRATLTADATLPSVSHRVGRAFADGLHLIGFDSSAASLPADDILRVDLYWTVSQAPSERYQSVIHLVGPEGFRWSRRDTYRPTDYRGAPPTTAWRPARTSRPGSYALDSHEIEPLPAVPPGEYEIVLTVFDRETLIPISVLDEQGRPTSPELTLGHVTLTAPQEPPDPESLTVQHRLDERLGPVNLIGVNVSRRDAAPGDPVEMTAFWQVAKAPATRLSLDLELLAADGAVAASYDLPPTAVWHPSTTWLAGDVWRGQHRLHLPAALETGIYTWALSLSPVSSELVAFAPLSVTAPARTFDQPPVDAAVDLPLGDVATLVGYGLRPEAGLDVQADELVPGMTFSVELVWQADAVTDASYRVFVHLIGPQGQLIAQSDGVPGGWTRPTTGWLPGEYIVDVHEVSIPPDAPQGRYALQAGMYGPRGDRLAVPDGTDAVRLAEIDLEPDE